MTPVRALPAALALVLALGAAAPGNASDDEDHERARRAVTADGILPLHEVLRRVEQTHPGQVLEVELERKQGEWIYEIKLLRKGGALAKLKVLARDARVLDAAERPRRTEAPKGER